MPTPFYFYDMDLLRSTLATAVERSYALRLSDTLRAEGQLRSPHIRRNDTTSGTRSRLRQSGNEVRAAIEAGFPAGGIVFAGVGKTDREIEYALGQDIFSFNCESAAEMEAINAIAERMGRRARVALRINPDVDPMTHRYISTGKADNKFGISYTEIDRVIASLKRLSHLEIVGLHFHVGSQIGCMEVFEHLCERVNAIRSWFASAESSCASLNMGGGLAVDYENPDREPIPDFAAYFAVFNRRLETEPGQTVHFELGRSLVGQCGDLVTRALYGKTTAAGTQVVIVDAGMTDLIRPALYGARHRIENLTSSGKPLATYTVVGPICESSDTFATGHRAARNLPGRSAGDPDGGSLRHGHGFALQSARLARSRVQRRASDRTAMTVRRACDLARTEARKPLLVWTRSLVKYEGGEMIFPPFRIPVPHEIRPAANQRARSWLLDKLFVTFATFQPATAPAESALYARRARPERSKKTSSAMKISFNWLKQYIETDLDAEQAAEF